VTRVLVRRSAGLYAYEQALTRAGLVPIAGADEAGRGACAGPLVVASVVLPQGRAGVIEGLADSKLLRPERREALYDQIKTKALAVSVVVVSVEEIDARGVHQANLEGMRRALRGSASRPAYVLTDGFPIAGLGVPGLAVWKGDRVSASIAAASIIAKVERDRMMIRLHEEFPHYGFAIHKGYATAQHQNALKEWGASPVHRLSFANVHAVGREGA
jgi:ribonuclease HII